MLNGTATTYSYDATNQVTGDGTTTLTYDANGNRTNTGYSTSANQSTTDGTWNYTYDNEGNLVEKVLIAGGEAWTYAYDNKNELVQAHAGRMTRRLTGLVAETVTYTVRRLRQPAGAGRLLRAIGDDGGARVRLRRLGSAKATPVGNENYDVWADLDGSNNLQTRYLRGDVVDQLFARVNMSGATGRPTGAHRPPRLSGDVIDSSGTIMDTIGYGAFGSIASEADASYRGAICPDRTGTGC